MSSTMSTTTSPSPLTLSSLVRLNKVEFALLSYNQSQKGFLDCMVFNATFNNISVVSWWLVLWVEEIGGPGENHRLFVSHLQMLYTSP
jgi:hypothetical protein